MAGKVLIACKADPLLLDALLSRGYELDIAENVTRQYALEHIGTCTGVITSTRLELDRGLLEQAHALQWIGRMGSGMEIIDTTYAAERGIQCFSSPDGNCNSVAEHVVGMLLALTRNIITGHNEMVQGVWRRDPNRGIELAGRTIGIIGFGHTGSAVARKLAAFDMRVLAYDKYVPEKIKGATLRCDSLDAIFKEAEIVSFHVPLQADTIHYLNHDFVARMARPFVLVNASRGGVADLRAVHDGLQSGKITGACLDVYEDEPPFAPGSQTLDILSRLSGMRNVVLTPHIAGYSHESIRKMSASLLQQIFPGT